VTLADHTAAASVPREWQARSTWDGDKGEIVTGPIAGAPLEDFSAILTKFGYDPELTEIVGKVSQWKKEQKDGEWLTSYFFGVQSKRDSIDLPALYAEAARTKHKPLPPRTGESTTVIVLADPQIGKTDHRGGTPELLARLDEKRQALEAYLKRGDSSRNLIVDVGDGVESFENVASQGFTNDLSFPQQLDVYGTELFKFETLACKYAPTDVLVVPSNHASWRNGKQQLGRPQDDWGLYAHRQVAKQAEAAGLPVTHLQSEDWTESVVFDVRGTIVGATHGHQVNRPDGFPNWWAGQTHGGQAFAHADVAITGHFHHLRLQPTGRNPKTGRSKWWIQAPTLDNGSSWYRNNSGDDSDPGLLVFRITDDGFDLSSLAIL
jgi:hypothetical protein